MKSTRQRKALTVAAAVFLKDSGSGLYLAHSGKVGGGRKGIGKTNFLEEYGGTLRKSSGPMASQQMWFSLGKIGGKSFINNLAVYIRAVENFKANATGQTPSASHGEEPRPLLQPGI